MPRTYNYDPLLGSDSPKALARRGTPIGAVPLFDHSEVSTLDLMSDRGESSPARRLSSDSLRVMEDLVVVLRDLGELARDLWALPRSLIRRSKAKGEPVES
jgi:hypothetical protein